MSERQICRLDKCGTKCDNTSFTEQQTLNSNKMTSSPIIEW